MSARSIYTEGGCQGRGVSSADFAYRTIIALLLRLEQQDCTVSQVEVYEVLGLCV